MIIKNQTDPFDIIEEPFSISKYEGYKKLFREVDSRKCKIIKDIRNKSQNNH